MTKLDELMTEWDKDSQIDRTEPGKELTNIPQLSISKSFCSKNKFLAFSKISCCVGAVKNGLLNDFCLYSK